MPAGYWLQAQNHRSLLSRPTVACRSEPSACQEEQAWILAGERGACMCASEGKRWTDREKECGSHSVQLGSRGAQELGLLRPLREHSCSKETPLSKPDSNKDPYEGLAFGVLELESRQGKRRCVSEGPWIFPPKCSLTGALFGS